MFEEGVEVLFKAFEGTSFSHKGKYDPARWQPIQSGSERAFEFMAKYGIGGGSAEGGAVGA